MTGETESRSRVVDPESFRDAMLLVCGSAIVLFQELALIRWLPSQVRVLAYFPNVVLISSFLGLGVGCLLARRRSILWTWPVALLILAVAAYLASGIAFTQESVSEFLWLMYEDLPEGAPVVHGIAGPIIVAFILTAASFVALGQFVASLLNRYRERGRPLIGYVFDLGGSLVGIGAFAVFSFLRTEPLSWFATVGLLGLLLFRRRDLLIPAASILGVLVTVGVAERSQLYSPYYAISLRPGYIEDAFIVLTNGSRHQYGSPVEKHDAISAGHARFRDGYHLPYWFLEKRPETALILGAGTGNDVAVALDEGVERIDAVEIDPVIFEIGEELHPNHPYSSERVTMHNTDARVFLNQTDEKYDLIVYGTLDSMTKLSALSSVRLDNYVYTVEGIRAAKARLKEDGALVMYFWLEADFIDERLASMIEEVFGESPVVVRDYFLMFNRIYMAGRGVDRDRAAKRGVVAEGGSERLSTDDWPYLYLERPAVTPFYLSVLFGILLISIVAVASVGGLGEAMRRGRVDFVMFLYGLAFLLLETKAITEMNLVWGTTWLTNAVVFASILAMILLSTLMMHFRPIPIRYSIFGLTAALILNWAAPYDAVAVAGVTTRFLFSMLFVGLPIFFAATSFAVVFESRENVDVAFGWNLLGAVVGGLTEFLSMAIGFRALAWVALAAYLLAYTIYLQGRGKESPGEVAA